jgi:hypothetical protein
MAVKIRSTTSFGVDVKPSVPCKILRQVKEPNEHERETSWAKFNGHFFARFLLLHCEMSLLAIARKIWWSNQE